MNRDQAYGLVRQTFTQAFNRERYANFAKNLLNRLDESTANSSSNVKDAFRGHVERYERIGTYTSPDDSKVDVLIVHLTKGSKLERARTAIRNFVADHLKARDERDAALVAFVSPTEKQWRFSYVKMEYATFESESGKVGVEARLTPARRFSYIVGEGESCHTAQTRFLQLLQNTDTNPPLADIESAFSVEAVTKEFFAKYAELFADINTALENLVAKDTTIRGDFKASAISTVDFAKKLMGQIVFLYFLQKKGWLGVAKGEEWGDGPRDFLRRLASGEYGKYANFFNDILEPLFYDTLATDRGHLAWCSQFNCRIPFLNGGLFEPLGDYDWQKTDVLLPNRLFTNTDPVEEGITGSGVLDVFDRYNFTVSEAEPLEKEVAIDPEMLGKVFENLIEENRRKGIGAYYTPREIVHYMCQESLINYLDTAINTRDVSLRPVTTRQVNLFGAGAPEQVSLKVAEHDEVVPRVDIETFVHLGEQIAHYEAVETNYRIRMPASIEQQAKLIDTKLADITVCDPAVGSGAFPVGMMTEIVRARSSLTPYFNDIHERTPYHFKRHAIQSCLYGVDIDPGAVEIAKLRLWLSLVVDEEDVKQIKPLPNLYYKIVSGDSLLGVEKTLFNDVLFRELERLKPLYFDEPAKKRKDSYRQEIDETIRALTNGKKTFDFRIYFSEVFHNHGAGFDVLIANPPYGRILTSATEARVGQQIPEFRATHDAFVAFILRGLSVATTGGVLTYIVPTAWLGGPHYASLRTALLKKSIKEIVTLPFDMFAAAYVDTLILQCQNAAPTAEHSVRTFSYSKRAKLRGFAPGPWEIIQQAEWAESPDKKFLLTTAMVEVAAKFRSSCRQFADVVEMKRGVLFDRSLLTNKKAGERSHPYFEGDVYRYQLNYSAPKWVEFGPAMKERPQEFRWFAKERLLLRRLVNRKQRLMATLADGTFITNKNLYCILPRPGAPSLRVILGLLNSTLMSRLYIEAVSQATKDDFPQVTMTDVLRLPVPKQISPRAEKRITNLVDRILAAKQRDPEVDTTALEEEIDDIVYELYDLTPEEIILVAGSSPTIEAAG